LAFIRGWFFLLNVLLSSAAFAAAPIQLHINTAVDTATSAFRKTETNFTTLFQSVTSLTNTITYYGATNSPTVYSTTNLQLALDSSLGNAVIVPKGRFLIGAQIDLPDNTRLIGDGMSSILVLTNIDVGLSAYGKTNIQIIGLKFAGQYSQAISALFSTNVLIRECDFTDATRIPQSGWLAPVRAQSSFDVRIERCNFYGNGNVLTSFDTSAEILIGGSDVTRAVLIDSCNLVGWRTHYGIAALDMQDGRVVNNFIHQGNNLGVLNVGGYGIQSIGTLGYTALRNIISGNTITNAAGSGIYLSNNIGSKVVGNHVSNVTRQQTNSSDDSDLSIWIAGGIVLDHSSLSDIDHNTVSNSPIAGLVATGSRNAILDNTLVSTNSGNGILLTGDDTTLDRNFVHGFDVGIVNLGSGNRIGILNFVHDNTAPVTDVGGALVKTLTDADGATPSVRDAPSYYLNYSSSVSITDFTDGLPGMDRTFFAANGNVTFIHSYALLLAGSADLNLLGGQVLVLRRDGASAWHQIATVGSVNGQTAGEDNTSSNLGTQGASIQGLAATKSGVNLPFRSIEAGSGITLTSNATTVAIAAVSGETNTTANLGTQGAAIQGLASAKSGLVLQFRSLEAGSGITLTSNATTVAIAAVSGETNTASNLGTQGTTIQGLAKDKSLLDLRFRSLEAGTGVTLTSNATTVTIASSTGPGGETNTASNLGTPGVTIQPWYNSKSLLDLRFRSIQAGTGITLTSNANTVTVSATAPAGSYATIQEESLSLTARDTINFIGAAITAADNSASNRTDITLSQSPASASVVGTGRVLTAGRGLSGGGDLSADRTLSFAYVDTLAGNPTMNAGEAEFGNNGILFEGATANGFEGFLTLVDPTADRTWTLPNASGTIPVSVTAPLALSALGNLTIDNIPRANIASGTANVVLINDGSGEMAEAAVDSTQLGFSATLGLSITNNANVTNFTIIGNLAQNTANISALNIDWTVADHRTKALSGANAFTFSGLPTDGKVHYLQLLLTNSTGTASATFTNVDWRVPLGPFSMASVTNGVQQVTFEYIGGIIFGDWTGASSTNSTTLGDPVTPPHGGTGSDLSGSLDGAIPFFDTGSGKFISSLTAYTNALTYLQSSGLLAIYRTNAIASAPLLSLSEGSGSVPLLQLYKDKLVQANTNLSIDAGTSYSVRERINGVVGLELTSNLSTVIGDGTTTTSRTTKFLYVPTFAGVPSGVPASETAGTVPLGYDTVGNQLYFYNGAWVKLNPSNWTGTAATNSFLIGNATANAVAITNGITLQDVTASSLTRTDSSKKISPVTIGANLSFDGTTLSATPSANWVASGTTNSTLPGIASVNSEVITNALTLSAQTASRVLGLDASKNVVTSFSSARLSDTLTDETGTGAAVFATAPVLVTPTNSGVTTFTDRRRLTGIISPTQITAHKNDYNPTGFSTAAVVRITSDAAYNITGLLAGIAGDEVILFNIGTFNLTLVSASGSSDATNRFLLASDIVVLPNQGASLFYDGTSSRWKSQTATSAANGAGTAGQAAYWSGSSTLTGDTNFLWASSSRMLTLRSDTNATSRSVLTLENLDSTAGGTEGVSLDFSLATTAAATVKAARITATSSQDWTATASTQDSYLLFEVAQNGVLSPVLTVNEDQVIFQNSTAVAEAVNPVTFTGVNLSSVFSAAAGAQQNSPGLAWVGSGWKTDATAAAQDVAFGAYVKPVQGTAAPTGYLRFMSAIGVASQNEVLRIYDTGTLQTSGGRIISRFATSTNYTLTAANHYIASTATQTNTLTAASAVSAGQVFIIKNVAGTTTVRPAGSDTIDSVAADDVLTAKASHTYISDGVSNWELN